MEHENGFYVYPMVTQLKRYLFQKMIVVRCVYPRKWVAV